jgi:hypothetical protein
MSAGGVTGTSLNGEAVDSLRSGTRTGNSVLLTGSRGRPGLLRSLASFANGTITEVKVKIDVEARIWTKTEVHVTKRVF